MKVHFWDDPDEYRIGRGPFRDRLASDFSIATSIDPNDLGGVDILFVHGGDSHLFSSFGGLSVIFGGNSTNPAPFIPKTLRVGYINVNDLADRFEDIHSKLQKSGNLTLNQLYEIIFNLDPKLEELLEGFAEASPFEDNAKLQEAKAELKKYVNSLGADA